MHRIFKKLLKDATGISEFVIAANLDIRGFYSFSQKVESPDAAMFIKKVYMKLINDYFPNASFFKPTGDGLLIMISYTERNLQDVVRNTIDSCFNVIKDFSSFSVNDPMINFNTPGQVGIGLSRGTACRLISKNKTLDYSGRVLNLASRLMDLARPTGIIFDADFGIELLSDEQIKEFAEDRIYIKTVAEKEPINIYYTKKLTRISPLNKQFLENIKWDIKKNTLTLKQMKSLGPLFSYHLESQPVNPDDIEVKVTHSCVVRGRKRQGIVTTFNFNNFDYYLEAKKPIVKIHFDALVKQLEEKGIKNNWKVEIDIMSPTK